MKRTGSNTKEENSPYGDETNNVVRLEGLAALEDSSLYTIG